MYQTNTFANVHMLLVDTPDGQVLVVCASALLAMHAVALRQARWHVDFVALVPGWLRMLPHSRSTTWDAERCTVLRNAWVFKEINKISHVKIIFQNYRIAQNPFQNIFEYQNIWQYALYFIGTKKLYIIWICSWLQYL
jgi:hypothetical protein